MQFKEEGGKGGIENFVERCGIASRTSEEKDTMSSRIKATLAKDWQRRGPSLGQVRRQSGQLILADVHVLSIHATRRTREIPTAYRH
jgi:hypothetical protein